MLSRFFCISKEFYPDNVICINIDLIFGICALNQEKNVIRLVKLSLNMQQLLLILQSSIHFSFLSLIITQFDKFCYQSILLVLRCVRYQYHGNQVKEQNFIFAVDVVLNCHQHCSCSTFRRGRIHLKSFSLNHHIGFLGLQVCVASWQYSSLI